MSRERGDRAVVVIRKAQAKDAPAMWDIRNAAILAQCAGHYGNEELALWTEGDMPKDFVETIQRNGYVAISDHHIVGTGLIDLTSGELDALFIDPDYMRKGVGRQMVAHLEHLARVAGVPRLHLNSTLNAAPFYRACGFVGDRPTKYHSPRGIELDCVPMTKAV